MWDRRRFIGAGSGLLLSTAAPRWAWSVQAERAKLPLAPFGRPADGAGRGVERDELPLAAGGVTVEQAVAEDRAAHVHRHVRVFPGLRRPPAALAARERVGVGALPGAGDDEE